MKWSLRDLSLALFGVLLASGVAWGQATAELAGRVTDESGAVLPGVTVTATQTDTGFTRTVVTDDTGAWVMPNLPTGPYRLEVSLQGFRTYVQTGIVLQVGATPTINAVLGGRQPRGDRLRRSRGADRRRAQRRHQRGRRAGADRRAAAAGTPGHRPDRAGRRGGARPAGRTAAASRAA